MAALLTTARIVCKDKEARVTVLQAFHKIILFTQPNEPEVLRYPVTLPIDDTAGTVLYMIEEYASQAASDAHLHTEPVQALIKLFTTGDVLAQPPEVHICPIAANKTTQPPPRLSSNPAIILAHHKSNYGTMAQALVSWGEVVEKKKRDRNIQGFTVCEDKEGACVRTLEMYDSWDVVDEKRIGREGLGAVRVKAIDGFLGREAGSKL